MGSPNLTFRSLSSNEPPAAVNRSSGLVLNSCGTCMLRGVGGTGLATWACQEDVRLALVGLNSLWWEQLSFEDAAVGGIGERAFICLPCLTFRQREIRIEVCLWGS